MSEIISQREFSRRLNVSEGTIRKAIANGWIINGSTTRPSGTPAINYEVALEEWNNSPAGIQAAQKGNEQKTTTKTPVKEKPSTTPPKYQPVNTETKAPLFDPALSESKKQIIEDKKASSRIQMQRQALQLQKELGQVVNKEKVYSALYELGKSLRENILNVPDRYIDLILSAPTRSAAHNILTDGLTESLRSLTTKPDFSKD